MKQTYCADFTFFMFYMILDLTFHKFKMSNVKKRDMNINVLATSPKEGSLSLTRTE